MDVVAGAETIELDVQRDLLVDLAVDGVSAIELNSLVAVTMAVCSCVV